MSMILGIAACIPTCILLSIIFTYLPFMDTLPEPWGGGGGGGGGGRSPSMGERCIARDRSGALIKIIIIITIKKAIQVRRYK